MNTGTTEIHIPQSRKRIALLMLAALAFVALGLWLVMTDDSAIRARAGLNSPLLVHGAGWASIAFFGTGLLVAVKKLVANEPGVTLGQNGLRIGVTAIDFGLVPWTEISGFSRYTISGQHFLVIELHEPLRYANTGNALRRRINHANLKMCGSPVSIPVHTLQVSMDELEDMCRTLHLAFGQPAHNAA